MDLLEDMTEDHAPWLADWIEYIGDKKTAQKIRKKTSDFKKTINSRHEQLSKHKPWDKDYREQSKTWMFFLF